MHARTLDDNALLTARALRRLVAGLAMAAAAIVLLGAVTDIDLRLADAFYDAHAHAFPWRHAWLTERFGHGIVKMVLTALAVCLVAVSAADGAVRAYNRRRSGAGWLPSWWRTRLAVLAASSVLVPLATSLLKRASHSHCPWDLARYGGSHAYYRLLDSMPDWVAAGHCLPGGHASTALWLVALAVFWLPHQPRTAASIAALMLGAGGALGWLQQMRGAHFLTHTLWSMWIATAIVTGLLFLQQRGPTLRRAPRRRAIAPSWPPSLRA